MTLLDGMPTGMNLNRKIRTLTPIGAAIIVGEGRLLVRRRQRAVDTLRLGRGGSSGRAVGSLSYVRQNLVLALGDGVRRRLARPDVGAARLADG